jgi:putative two-component system hydrogenase maturation factor HypX/HoxX
LKILLLCTSFNSLSQKFYEELVYLNHTVSVEFALNEETIIKGCNLFQPDLILCPFLKQKIPQTIWQHYKCIVIHPGIVGDRGAYSLDWAIYKEEAYWGVTALEAIEEIDAGDIWGTYEFPIRRASKASLYKEEISFGALHLLNDILKNIQDPNFKPTPLNYEDPNVKGQLHHPLQQRSRKINWQEDTTLTIIKKINCADSYPGVLETLFNEEYYLFGAHGESTLRGETIGEIFARRHGAVCITTINGAVWISHLKPHLPNSYKLPCTVVLKEKLKGIYESRIALLLEENLETFKEIYYEEKNDVGYLHFDFHNGAMSIEQCVRLKYAYELACQKDIKVLVLMGGENFFSNGIHLNIMEDSKKQAEDGWSNIHAMNDIVRDVILTSHIITVASIGANAGAGGAILPLACDYVLARDGIILNPHYKTLGLHGSEYWTYLLPKRVGTEQAFHLTQSCLPLGVKRAKTMGYIDEILPRDKQAYLQELQNFCKELAQNDNYYDFLDEKETQRANDEAIKPLQSYRDEELAFMYESFYNENSPFNTLRKEFVYKRCPRQTPLYLAHHRK